MPEIKFNEQTYTALHTSATANKVLGVKQPKQRKKVTEMAKKRGKLILLIPCLQLMPRYSFCCFECAYQKTHKALTCIQKNGEPPGRGRDEAGKAHGIGMERRRSGARKFSSFSAAISLWGKAQKEEGLFSSSAYDCRHVFEPRTPPGPCWCVGERV